MVYMEISTESSLEEKESWLYSHPSVSERGVAAWRKIMGSLDDTRKEIFFAAILEDQSIVANLTDYAVTVVDHYNHGLPLEVIQSQAERVLQV
jgi:hypothetical protein